MKTLKFTNNSSVFIEFITDLISFEAGSFTVMEIRGLDTVEEEALFQAFQRLPFSLEDFKALALLHNLELREEDQDHSIVLITQDGHEFSEEFTEEFN